MNNLAEKCNNYSVTRGIFSHPIDYVLDVATALVLIESTVGITTARSKNLTECDIPDRLYSKVFERVDEHTEIIMVSAEELKRIRGTRFADPRVYSSYDLASGRIFLVNGLWCYSHLIHEVLHSRSSLSREELSGKNLRFIYEGLTEFLVGVILKNTLTDCYLDWQVVNLQNPCLSSLYLDFVRPWQFLYKKLNFQEIIAVYFGVTIDNPLAALDAVLARQIGDGYNLSFAENMTQKSLFYQFKDSLEEVYGEEFLESQNSVVETLEI